MYSAISSFASNLRNPWPIIRTHNIEDLSQVEGCTDQYVWLLDERFEFDDDFPLAWIPTRDQATHIHLFPLIKHPTNKIIRNIAALVPTSSRNRKWPIQQQLPVSMRQSTYDIFLVGDGTPTSRRRFAKLSKGKTNMYMIRDSDNSKEVCKQVLRNISSNYAWMINIDTEFPAGIQTNVTVEEKKIYQYDFGELIPIEYFFAYLKFQEIELLPFPW